MQQLSCLCRCLSAASNRDREGVHTLLIQAADHAVAVEALSGTECFSAAASSVQLPIHAALESWHRGGVRTLLVQAADHVVAVVGEEALVVQRVAQQLSDRAAGHRLGVAVLVHHVPEEQLLLQPAAVGLKVGSGHHAVLGPAQSGVSARVRRASRRGQWATHTSRIFDWSRVRMEKPEDSLLLQATMQ